METLFSKEDKELQNAFGIIISIESLTDCVTEIAELIYKNELNTIKLNEILAQHKIKNIEDIKGELLDLVIGYINIVLKDHIITEKEIKNVKLLKLIFKIKPGDFYDKRYYEIEEIIITQLKRLYFDNIITTDEEIYNVNLQDIFDLSYDQLYEFKYNEVKEALQQGANITDLDTANLPSNYYNIINQTNRFITQQVKDLVWNRDNGQCRECGSNEKLEFDHIIPYSKGGSNTYRNVQLLCESCNRKKKSDNIG
jgi:hypothetical protein